MGRKTMTLEEKVSNFDKRLLVLYQKLYALTECKRLETSRNKEIYRVKLQMKRWDKSLRKYGDMRKLGKVVGAISRGRMIVTLKPQEYVLLLNSLQRTRKISERSRSLYKNTNPIRLAVAELKTNP